MTEGGPVARSSSELRARITSGVLLIGAVVLVVVVGGPWFAMFAAAAALFGVFEWHRLISPGELSRETLLSGLAILVGLGLAYAQFPPFWAVGAILVGSVCAAASAAARRSWILWHGFGAIYLGVPALALVLLRGDQAVGGAIVGGIFAAVWAADTAALFAGRSFGGPRLAPRLSPNKTWSGFLVGVLAAGVAEVIYVASLNGTVWAAFWFGLFLGLAAACGDLFESWVKRQFQAKNSGTLIPGHGGMLDRIDSLLFSAPAGAAFLLCSGLDLFGGQR